jgi:hypothetical protein
LWNFSLNDISSNVSDFFPRIDYSKFYIDKAKNWLEKNQGKKVLVSNGYCTSGQASNFPLTPIINKLAIDNTGVIFILTNNNDGRIEAPNVIHSSDIIQKNAPDLNENAFISSQCDLIIGRYSGAFSFAMNYNNMFERNVKFLCLAYGSMVAPGKLWLHHGMANKINYSASIYQNSSTDATTVYNIIKGLL